MNPKFRPQVPHYGIRLGKLDDSARKERGEQTEGAARAGSVVFRKGKSSLSMPGAKHHLELAASRNTNNLGTPRHHIPFAPHTVVITAHRDRAHFHPSSTYNPSIRLCRRDTTLPAVHSARRTQRREADTKSPPDRRDRRHTRLSMNTAMMNHDPYCDHLRSPNPWVLALSMYVQCSICELSQADLAVEY